MFSYNNFSLRFMIGIIKMMKMRTVTMTMRIYFFICLHFSLKLENILWLECCVWSWYQCWFISSGLLSTSRSYQKGKKSRNHHILILYSMSCQIFFFKFFQSFSKPVHQMDWCRCSETPHKLAVGENCTYPLLWLKGWEEKWIDGWGCEELQRM